MVLGYTMVGLSTLKCYSWYLKLVSDHSFQTTHWRQGSQDEFMEKDP